MRFGSSPISLAAYNIIFYIINLLIKISIQQTFMFYTSYNEVNINHIYMIAFANLKRRFDIIYKQYIDNSGYV